MTAELIKRIKAHGASVVWRTLEVPAWGEPAGKDDKGNEIPAKPAIIQVKTLSLDEQKEWSRKIGEGGLTDRLLLIMDRVYREDKKERVFDPTSTEHLSVLRNHADPLIIGALVAEILRLSDVEVARKN